MDENELLALASLIGERIAAGRLPAQDENGFYRISEAAEDVRADWERLATGVE